jgi:hypothetical protein
LPTCIFRGQLLVCYALLTSCTHNRARVTAGQRRLGIGEDIGILLTSFDTESRRRALTKRSTGARGLELKMRCLLLFDHQHRSMPAFELRGWRSKQRQAGQIHRCFKVFYVFDFAFAISFSFLCGIPFHVPERSVHDRTYYCFSSIVQN